MSRIIIGRMPTDARSRRTRPSRCSTPVAADAPLAARMRPRTLDEFVGQPHLVGHDGALSRVVQPGYLPSMVLWGPPGPARQRWRGCWRTARAARGGSSRR